MLSKYYFRFLIAVIANIPVNAIPFTYPLAEQILEVSKGLIFQFSEYGNPQRWHTFPV